MEQQIFEDHDTQLDRWGSSHPHQGSSADASRQFGVRRKGVDLQITTPEFDILTREARQMLIAAALRRSYASGETIYLQDDEAVCLYFVVSGHVRISFLMEDGSSVLCSVMRAGECFGELGVFEAGLHCDMATAAGTTILAAIPTGTFRGLCRRYPEIGEALSHLVAHRYRDYIDLTRSLSLKSLAGRLSQALLRLADSLGTKTSFSGREVQVIGSVITQADLGLMARGARGNVNRALKAWERRGWIAIQNRQILLLNRARLEELATEEAIRCPTPNRPSLR